MRGRTRSLVLGAIAGLTLCCFPASKGGGRSGSLKCGGGCSAYQNSDPLPDQPAVGVIRIAIGGDSRDDISRVVPWAFGEARKRGAKAFLFLGDLELTPAEDAAFLKKLAELDGVPFYPVAGNHEVETLGFIRSPGSRHRVKEFKDRFVRAPGIVLAPFVDEAVYFADLEGGVRFFALDNVSLKGEGFGTEQLTWLEKHLNAASAARMVILVGMHKALAQNPITTHAMDEDGPRAIQDSNSALGLFKKYKVAMVFVSHSHMYASYNQDGVAVRLTGGLGAPLVKGLAEPDGGFHHFLLVDVPPGDDKTSLHVEVVKFPGTATRDDKDESEEVE